MDVELTGQYKESHKQADVGSVMREIKDAREDAIRRKFEALD